MQTRLEKIRVDGILLLDKPIGITSNAALQRVKRLFNAKKAGHTGSLDPLASGMLPICFGEATKFSQFLLEADKSYLVDIQLGKQTTTGDAEGEIISEKPVGEISATQLQKVLQAFTGEIMQIPPMYSAIKHHGKPLYKLARQGIEVERKPRAVKIHQLLLHSYQDETLQIEVHCSKGTYIRTLAADIGERLGCGAYVKLLRRLCVAPYHAEKMLSLALLEDIYSEKNFYALQQLLLPLESSLGELPTLKLSSALVFYLRAGQPVRVPQAPTQGLLRLYADDGKFLGVGEVLEDGRIAPVRLVK